MKSKYCFWSVCDGPYGAAMERCVRSARAAGVFTQFHVLADRCLEGCECYDAFEFDKADGLFKLHYLKAGMTRLSFDYYVWVDADTIFTRSPLDLLGVMGKSPVHVPLELDAETAAPEAVWKGIEVARLKRLLSQEGVRAPAFLSSSAFWIVHHDAIDLVHSLALLFWHKGRAAGLHLDVSAGLGYAMQMLCADAERHRLARRPDLWATDYSSRFMHRLPASAWPWRHPLSSDEVLVRPALVHLGVGASEMPGGKLEPDLNK